MNQSNETGVLVEARSVEKTFKRGGDLVRAVSGVSLTIASGETVGLIGESGVGQDNAWPGSARPPRARRRGDRLRGAIAQQPLWRGAPRHASEDAGRLPGALRVAEPTPTDQVDHRRATDRARRREDRVGVPRCRGARSGRFATSVCFALPGRIEWWPAAARWHRPSGCRAAEVRCARRADCVPGPDDPPANYRPADATSA